MESSILSKLYTQRDKSFQDIDREQVDPKDMQGQRLSHYWKLGNKEGG